MFEYIWRLTLSAAVFWVALAPALTQEEPKKKQEEPKKNADDEYRRFFKKPETAAEFWAAMKFEIEVGKFDLAADYLKGFLAKNPTDEELLQIEEQEGMAAFLRLLLIPALRADAKGLVERVSAVVKKHISNPDRIKKFVKNLGASEEERLYAISELRRFGAIAVPYLVGALRQSTDTLGRVRILSALEQLNKDIVPPLLAALDINDVALRLELIDVLKKRGAKAAVPYLWFLSASPKQPESVRTLARQTLAYLQETSEERLPPAKAALTREAERYYEHQVKFPDPTAVTVWQWDSKQFVLPPPVLSASQAEEYYGLRFARQALELDPTYEPAQVIFLSLALEKGYERAGLDQPLDKGAAQVKELLKVVNPQLLIAVLDRALSEDRLPVILGAVRTLGELGEVRAARPWGKKPPVLVRALYYPDRRVQFAAADAFLMTPGAAPELAGTRIVEILRRALGAEPRARALVAEPDKDRASQVGQALRQAGFAPVVVNNGRDVMRQVEKAADIDVLLIDQAITYPQLPYLLAELRADVNAGLLPIIITLLPDSSGNVPVEREQNLRRLAERYRHVWVMPRTVQPETLKRTLQSRIAEASGKPLSEKERKAYAAVAMLWLKRLATGEVAGYDVRPAEDAIFAALQAEELAPLAIETTGRLPGREPQRQLAAIVLDNGRRAELRSAAAVELARHIQQHGLVLAAGQVKAIEELFRSTPDGRLKANVALVIGSMHPDATQTGERLQRYEPPARSQPAAPAPAREK